MASTIPRAPGRLGRVIGWGGGDSLVPAPMVPGMRSRVSGAVATTLVRPHRLTAIAIAIAIAATACGDDGPDMSGRHDAPVSADTGAPAANSAATNPAITVVAIATQRCARPTLHRGVGTVLADGLVLTAAHVVDGELRSLDVDGAPGRVLALDVALDLALVGLDGASAPGAVPTGVRNASPGPVTVLTIDGTVAAEITRRITLRVDDVSARARYERPALELAGVAAPGHSGAPVVDDDGHIVGVVIATAPGDGITYAVRPPETTADLAGTIGRTGCVHE